MELAQSAIEFFICLVKYGAGLVGWFIIEAINEVLAIFGWAASLISLIIPGLDFQAPKIPTETLSYINWIFPLGFLSQLYTYSLAAFAIYRIMRWAANRAKGPIQPKLFD